MRRGCDLLQPELGLDALEAGHDRNTFRGLGWQHPQACAPDLRVVGGLIGARIGEQRLGGRIGEQGIPQSFAQFPSDLGDTGRRGCRQQRTGIRSECHPVSAPIEERQYTVRVELKPRRQPIGPGEWHERVIDALEHFA